MKTNTTHPPLPRPRAESDTGALPSAVTFFMTRSQRAELLGALRAHGHDRTQALLIAVGLRGPDAGACS
jgi:hypothetical protein